MPTTEESLGLSATKAPASVVSLSLQRNLNPIDAFWAQHEHHAARRRERQRRFLTATATADDTTYKHPIQWRRKLVNNNPAEVKLSNCHLLLWSGRIYLGTPFDRQEFQVHFDTGTADSWVPSTDCKCLAFPDWRKYDASESTSYELPTDNDEKNKFLIRYEDGEWVEGVHAMDVLTLGYYYNGIQVPNHVFGAVTQVHNYATCEAEEGVLGLAYSPITSQGFPSLLQNLLQQKVLPRAMYSLYLNSEEDYPELYTGNVASFEHHADAEGNLEYGYHRPKTAQSQLVFGGVDQRHYEGCLQWHPLKNTSDQDLEENGSGFVGFWDFALQDVKVGGTSISSSHIALLDTGSSYLIGPTQAVAKFALLNHASCFQMLNHEKPQLVECTSGLFDAAVIDCKQPFFSLAFIADGKTYVLEKEDLVIETETSFGTTCVLRVVASEGIPGWVLGDVFFNKYYVAFDFENERVGLAPSTVYTESRCGSDEHLDIRNHEQESTVSKPTTGPEVTAAPTPLSTSMATFVAEEEEAQDETYDFANLPEEETPSFSSPLSSSSASKSSSESSIKSNDKDPWAMALGFSIGLVAILLVAWRRQRVRKQKRINEILRQAEANSPYNQDQDPEAELSSASRHPSRDHHNSRFVEIDLQTLHRMN